MNTRQALTIALALAGYKITRLRGDSSRRQTSADAPSSSSPRVKRDAATGATTGMRRHSRSASAASSTATMTCRPEATPAGSPGLQPKGRAACTIVNRHRSLGRLDPPERAGSLSPIGRRLLHGRTLPEGMPRRCLEGNHLAVQAISLTGDDLGAKQSSRQAKLPSP